MDPDYLSSVIKNLEPEFRVRGRAIQWSQMNGLLYDNAMTDLVNNPTAERVDAVMERYDAFSQPEFTNTEASPSPLGTLAQTESLKNPL